MASGRNTPEYQTVLALVESVRLAVRPNLVTLGGALLARGLISSDNESSLRNQMLTEPHRAARCVELVQDMIEQDASNYQRFIEVLESDKFQYKTILSKLREKYAAKRQEGVSPDSVASTLPPAAVTGTQVTDVPPPVQASKLEDNPAIPQATIVFSEGMSDTDFLEFLKKKGVQDGDCAIIQKNAIGARVFVKYMTEADIDSSELNFTFGGKKVLKRLKEELSASTNGDQEGPLEFNESDKKHISIDGGGEKIPVECFDPYKIDRSKRRPLLFTFGKVTPRSGKKVSNVKMYNMKKSPHGIALIINNEFFADKERRTGTDIDERNLTHAFRYLGYKVEVHREVDSGRMTAIMKNMAERPEHAGYDSFICCILSHGSAGHIYGTDDQAIPLDNFTEMFSAYRCPSLHNKPKLFFLQACRGPLTELAVDADGPGDYLPKRSEIPKTVDFFFGHATPLGYKAWRDHNTGSWYISELCRTLCEMNVFGSLNDIMTEVCSRVSRNEDYKYVGYRMVPEITSRLEGNVFF